MEDDSEIDEDDVLDAHNITVTTVTAVGAPVHMVYIPPGQDEIQQAGEDQVVTDQQAVPAADHLAEMLIQAHDDVVIAQTVADVGGEVDTPQAEAVLLGVPHVQPLQLVGNS